MDRTAINALIRERQPVRKTVRRLRWFKQSFNEQIGQLSARTGVQFAINEQAQAAAFVDWLRAFEAQKPTQAADRRRYVGFAAGLMLRALIKHAPLRVTAMPADADRDDPAYFWPEGYAYVSYCINVRAAVLQQDFDEQTSIAPELADVRTWWSFKENVQEDHSLGIAFLDLFTGVDPQWDMPDAFRGGDIRRITAHIASLPGADPADG